MRFRINKGRTLWGAALLCMEFVWLLTLDDVRDLAASVELDGAAVVDDETGKVLTLAYMNEESLKISLDKKLTCFYSRSRQELWLKGETSGNYQHIVSITADCDYDALEVLSITSYSYTPRKEQITC